MDKIKIKESKTADTRTCDWSRVTKKQLLESSIQHIGDIRKAHQFFIAMINRQAEIHDLSKITHIDDFYRNFKTGFKEFDWWEYHQKVERHHFQNPKFIQDDINLFDVLDQIADGVMAGMARSGEYRKEPIDKALLMKAYDNTIDLLLSKIEVSE